MRAITEQECRTCGCRGRRAVAGPEDPAERSSVSGKPGDDAKQEPLPPVRRNLRDAARIYGVSDWTLRQAIAAGDLPAVALGSGGRKVYSVRLDDVEAWFRAQPDAFAEMCR